MFIHNRRCSRAAALSSLSSVPVGRHAYQAPHHGCDTEPQRAPSRRSAARVSTTSAGRGCSLRYAEDFAPSTSMYRQVGPDKTCPHSTRGRLEQDGTWWWWWWWLWLWLWLLCGVVWVVVWCGGVCGLVWCGVLWCSVVLLLLLFFGRVFNSVFVHSCDANAAVSETDWWAVTWESRLPATPLPLLCLTQEKLF